jgi:metal-responsive CopG/Arc/MetJ family transcriptional regulator
MGTISIRLDAETATSLERLAREQGKSKSEIVREALHQLAKRNGKRSPKGETLYDRIKDIVGSCSGGPSALSVDTGKKYAAMLWERKRARDADRRRATRRTRTS